MILRCDITLPASKSESNRALMIAAYGGFAPDFQNVSASSDTLILTDALHTIRAGASVVNIADCGTAARFMTAFLACHEGDWLLTGSDRMKQRPVKPLVDALLSLGADIQYTENQGFLPLQIHGKTIQGGKAGVDMTQSSQFASSLLLAAPMFSQGLELDLQGCANSLPYLDMTIGIMRYFSAQVEKQGSTIFVKPQSYQKQPFSIEPDWTAASYWYEMGAFSDECEIKLRGLSLSSLQGDAIIAEWMAQLGVDTCVEDDAIVLRKTSFEKHPLHFDFAPYPDLYPTMAATCAGLGVEASFSGLDNLVFKESDRIAAMQAELARMGDRPIRFYAYNDHRIVMALAPLAMLVGPVGFDHPEVVEKSYPGFWDDASFLPVRG